MRAEVEREGRELLIEAELAPRGRNRIQVNRQRLQRSRDLLGALRVSVFAPDDLALVKEGPAERRRYLDDALVAAHPRLDGLRSEVDRILRQRNALLRQCHGRLGADAALTLDVWDAKLAAAAEELVRERIGLLDQLSPALVDGLRQSGRHAKPTSPRPTARRGSSRASRRRWSNPAPTRCAAA